MFPLKVAPRIILLLLFSSYPSHFRFTLPSFPLEAYIAIPGSHSHSRISYSPSKFTIPFQDHIPIPNLGKMKRVARVTPWGSHLPGGRGRRRKGWRRREREGEGMDILPTYPDPFPRHPLSPLPPPKFSLTPSPPNLTLLSVPSKTTSASSNIMLSPFHFHW